MKKDVLFWIGVKSDDDLLQRKHGGFKYLDISRPNWEWWCKKNDVIFFPYEKTTEKDTGAHRPTWQRWFDVFKQLEEAGIEYNKIALIDGNTIVRWDCPNFIKMAPSGKLTAWRSLDNLGWLSESVEGYKELFDGYDFDMGKYISCGFQIFDESHKVFLGKLKDFYYINYNKIMELQHQKVKKGTDQAVYNYFLQVNNIDVNMEMPSAFMINHMQRFDWFSHNWQLKEDNTPWFIKYGWIWFYSGFPERGQRYDLMKQTWDMVKNNYE